MCLRHPDPILLHHPDLILLLLRSRCRIQIHNRRRIRTEIQATKEPGTAGIRTNRAIPETGEAMSRRLDSRTVRKIQVPQSPPGEMVQPGTIQRGVADGVVNPKGMNNGPKTMNRFDSIAGILPILLLPGCYTQFVAEENEVTPDSQQVSPAPIRYVYFPQNKLVPIPGWEEITGRGTAPTSQEVAEVPGETVAQPTVPEEPIPQPTVPESWTVLVFPVAFRSGEPAQQSDQENGYGVSSGGTARTTPTKTVNVLPAPTGDVQRTSGNRRSQDDTNTGNSQSETRQSGTTRHRGR